jgi:hypothetical protein
VEKIVEHARRKQLQVICEIEDLEFENLKETLRHMFHFGPIFPWTRFVHIRESQIQGLFKDIQDHEKALEISTMSRWIVQNV